MVQLINSLKGNKMTCTNKITQIVPSGFSFKEVDGWCGQTGIDGLPVYCDSCSAKHERIGHKPYECKHGNDISEYDCDYCEMEA